MKNYFTPTHKLMYYALVLIPRILRLIVNKLTYCIKSDETYLKIIYFLTFGKWLDFEHPEKFTTFNEKIQWLKLNSNTPLHTQMVDKYEVRDIIQKKLGEGFTFPLLGVWNSFDEIDFSKLPEQFVLKPTHDSGSIVFCRDRKTFNLAAARKKLTKALKRNYYWLGRETPYKNVKPRLIAEPLMTDNTEKTDLKDYKLFCFDGEVKIIQVDYDRFTNHHRNLYTPEWQLIDAFIMYPNDPTHIIPPPEALPRMLEIASKLSKGFPFIRIDLYVINQKIYFGEFTFFHGGGLERIRPREYNNIMGSWIKLPL
jgi:hypothetical protein